MKMRDVEGRLRRRGRRAGVEIGGTLLQELGRYFDLLSRWNQKINLVSFSTPDEAVDRLLVEPLVAARHLPAGESVAALDVGSGAGSPAIPMRLAVPGMSFTMVEAKTRKAAFLREVIRNLSLAQVRVETTRFEQLLTNPELHESMDLVTIRAIRIESRALMGLQAFLRPGGLVLWFRGPSGPDVPHGLMPPLTWQATYPLVESLRSRLVVLRKTTPGSSGVPRGTFA